MGVARIPLIKVVGSRFLIAGNFGEKSQSFFMEIAWKSSGGVYFRDP